MSAIWQHSTDEIDEIFPVALGWEFDLTQLSGGPLGYRARSVTLPGVTLTWETMARPMRSQQLWQLEGMFCGLLLQAADPVFWKGQQILPHTPIIFGSDLQDFVLPGGCLFMTMEVAPARAGPMGLSGLEPGLWRGAPREIAEFTALCQLAQAPMAPPDVWADLILGQFLAMLIEPLHRSPTRKFDIIRRTEAFVASTDLAEEICIDQIADAIGVSRRTMHRAFKDLFDIGPKGYLRLVRLHQFRQSLRRAEGAAGVTEAALMSGFSHFGRAASQYQQLFGELPSQTLARGPRLS